MAQLVYAPKKFKMLSFMWIFYRFLVPADSGIFDY